MPPRACLLALLILSAPLAPHASAETVPAPGPPPALPDTPAARALGAWLEAFDSGERARIEAFDQSHYPTFGIERAMRFRNQTGGLDLLGIEKSTPAQISFHVRERGGPNEEIGVLRLSAADPAVIDSLRLFALPPGARFEDVALDAAARSRIIAAVGQELESAYVFADLAQRMAAALRARDRHGDYAGIADGAAFAAKLSAELRAASRDPHLELDFSPVLQPPNPPAAPAGPDPVFRRQLLAINCGFEKAEHLAPNIGYLKFNMFADPATCAATAAAAISFVADSDALILDLRDNNGGHSDMVMLIASYLFGAPTHIMDDYDRSANATTQSWTWAYVPGKRFPDKPLFVLTSKATFSAAEALSYALQTLKRATLIGEPTGGGAHMVREQPIDAHFTLRVPFARSLSPVTHTNWEGTGVTPDVPVPAADALAEALQRARRLR